MVSSIYRDISTLIDRLTEKRDEYIKEEVNSKQEENLRLYFKGKHQAYGYAAKCLKELLVWNGGEYEVNSKSISDGGVED